MIRGENEMLKRGRSRSAPLLASIVAAAALMLGGCGGGGSDGAAGPAGPAGATGATGASVSAVGTLNSNSAAPTADAAAAFLALRPQITVQSVTISSPPVVKFTVKDANGYAIAGLGSKAQRIVANLTNLNFILAKLVPGTNGSPSKWVSYIVTKPPTVAQAAGIVTASASCDSTTKPTVCGAFPSADTQGTLVDNGDGSYQYTFYRDVKQAAAQVASLIDSADGL